MKSLKTILLIVVAGLFAISCEDNPESIQGALFDEVERDGDAPELDLSFTFRTDINNTQNASRSENGIANWSERIYFDTRISNRLEETATDVRLIITDIDDNSLVPEYNTQVLSFGDIDSFNSAVPDRYWCFFCNQSNEVYLGTTWIDTNPALSTTASITIEMRITFTYDGRFESQDVTHTFTVFP